MKARQMFLVAMVLVSFMAYAATSEAGLVAYWSFDEGGGNVAGDASEFENDGQINNAEWVDGMYGSALKFESGFILVPNSESINFAQEQSYSISLWINYVAKDDYHGVIQKFNGGYPFKVEVNKTNQLYCSLWDQTNNPGANVGDVSGDWHHFGFVRDRSVKKLYGYLDGVLTATSDDTINAVIANDVDVYIGARKPGTTLFFEGMLDDIAIYDRILTEDEINAAMNGKIPEVKMAVQPQGSLVTVWANIRKGF